MEFFLSPDDLRHVPIETLLRVFYADEAGDALAAHGGSLRRLLHEPRAEYRTSQQTLRAAQEIVRRSLFEEMRERVVLTAPSAVREFLLSHYAGFQEERFLALWLDNQNRAICVDELFRGTISATAVYPREVVRHALAHNAAGVIFAHNHPSGLSEPSAADQAITSALKKALDLIDVRVLDHFVVGEGAVMSFAERGML